MDAAEALLEGDGAHRRRGHHVAPRLDVGRIGDDAGKMLEHQAAALEGDAVGHRVVAGRTECLQGVSEGDEKLLKEAFNVQTIEDLANLKYVKWAQAICTLADTEE